MSKVFREKNSRSFQAFSAKSFWVKIPILYLFLKVFIISKKIVFWEFVFGLKILYLFGDFSQVIFFVQNTLFSTLKPYLAILSIRISYL